MLFDVLVDDAGHRGAQSRQVCPTVGLGNVVGETQHLLGVAVVPLHRHLCRDGYSTLEHHFTLRVEDVGVQNGLAAVDVVDKALHATAKREVLLTGRALIDQLDAHTVVEEGEFAQTLGEDLVVEFDCAEDARISKKVHLGPGSGRRANHLQRTHLHAVNRLNQTIDRVPTMKLYVVFFAVAANGELEPVR